MDKEVYLSPRRRHALMSGLLLVDPHLNENERLSLAGYEAMNSIFAMGYDKEALKCGAINKASGKLNGIKQSVKALKIRILEIKDELVKSI